MSCIPNTLHGRGSRWLRMALACLCLAGCTTGAMQAQSLNWRQRLRTVNLPPLYPTCPEPDQYVDVIVDEFDKGQLDRWFWDANILGFNHTPGSVHTKEWCSISSLAFPPNTGMMRMMATADPIDTTGMAWAPPGFLFQDSLPNRRVWPFQAGAITARWGLTQGRFVLRTQITPGKDTWPAFWMFGDCADEIDIFEFMQTESDPRHDKWISHSVHTELICGEGINPDTKGYSLNQNVTTAMHTYGVEWDDFRIRFFTDGVVRRTFYHYYRRRSFAGMTTYKGVNTCQDIDPGAQYLEDPQFSNAMLKVIVNLAVRNSAVESDYPKHMDIAYFRHSDLIDCDETRTLHSQADIAGAYYHARYGDRTITAGEVVIDPQSTMSVNGPLPWLSWTPGDLLVVTAAEEIRILPGFEVHHDGNFIGQIRPCREADPSPDQSGRLFPETDAPEWQFWGDSLLANPAGTPADGQDLKPLRLFPNPATDAATLVGTESGDLILIRDALGRSLGMQPKATEGTTAIPLNGIAPGIYLVEVWRGGMPIGILRLVKE